MITCAAGSKATTKTIAVSADTHGYSTFVEELRIAVANPTARTAGPFLDGLAGTRCLALVPEATVNRLGTFFTPSNFAARLIAQLSVRSWSAAVVFDPACGAGDLLLPVARRLPIERTVSATLRKWNERISGCDVSAEFIEAARMRLVLLAARRGAELDGRPDALAKLLSCLSVGDGLAVSEGYTKSSHIVMNPPFGRVDSSKGTPWREGAVTAAALFVERAARLARPGAQIAVLLPEVLRTGSSYASWRSHIRQLTSTGLPRSLGLFSSDADVDVFVQRLTKRSASERISRPRRSSSLRTIGDCFSISVGPVVPHRHPEEGPEAAYLHAGNAVAWSELRRIGERRKFSGRLFAPPFVVIRRTSRPGDAHRAIATLVLGKRLVAVENHLIVALPKRGAISICRKLVEWLGSSTVNRALNRSMRCRHLTTESVSTLPWRS